MENNFKKLQDVELADIDVNTDGIKSGIASDMGLIRFLTSTVELYFPRIFDLFIGMAGGTPEGGSMNKRANKYPDMR